MMRSTRWLALFAGLFLAFSMTSVDYAEARRGGSFGSRGMRTQQVVPPTRTAPQQTAPVERSMTPSSTRQTTPTQMQQQRPGLFNGLGGGLMRGLLLGGLIGMLLGHGFGGLAGLFGFALQALLLVGALMLVMRLFASRNPAPAMAGGAPHAGVSRREAAEGEGGRAGSFRIPAIGGGSPAPMPATGGFKPTQADLDTFEQRLAEVQAAFAREDHAALRRLTTPEMVSYLSEELADNAQKGLRNDVSAVRLLQADIAEAWSEGETDYATAALNYEAIEVMRDRATGRVVEGDEHTPTETTEIWTFVRASGQDWKLSAIQQA